MPIRDQIVERIAQIASEKLPEIGGDALASLADEYRPKEPLIALILDISAREVRTNGPEATTILLEKIVDAMNGLDELPDLAGMDAAVLSQLVELYQAAEARDKQDAQKWIYRIVAVLKKLGSAALGVL